MGRPSVVVVGAGVVGLSTALALAARDHDVAVVDPGPVPHPLAASTDVSKIVRNDYGDDAFHVELMEEAFAGWDRWNATWARPPFRRCGFVMLRRDALAPGHFEHASHRLLAARGVPVERLDADRLRAEHPLLHHDWVAGYRNPTAGWVWSHEVVATLAGQLGPAGVALVTGRVVALADDRPAAVLADGRRLTADEVVVAAGAWTSRLLPELAHVLTTTAHPAIHLRPDRPERFRPPAFPAWAAEIAETGWYGLPLHPTGVVKVGRHAAGVPLDPDTTDRAVDDDTVAAMRTMLAGTWPALADARVVATRRCCYVDTPDGDFWIDRVPGRDGVVVASGGSGHAFKFAPVLGDVVADVLEDLPSRWRSRFAWRVPTPGRAEAARARA